MKNAFAAIVLCWAAIVVAGCGDDSSTAGGSTASTGQAPEVTIPDGPPPRQLIVKDLKVGTGVTASPGDELAVYFTAYRLESGEHFETIWKPDKPFTFKLNGNEVIPGWVRGLPGMKVGGRRYLVVPGQLASRFGTSPFQNPDEGALVYVVDLLSVNGSDAGAPGAKPAADAESSGSLSVESPAEAAKRDRPVVPVPPGPPPNELVVRDLIEGSGARANRGDELTVEYVSVGYLSGERLSGSWGPSKPEFEFTLGSGGAIPAWETGLLGMKAGGRRELIVPLDLLSSSPAPPRGNLGNKLVSYASTESDPAGTRVYVIDLLKVE